MSNPTTTLTRSTLAALAALAVLAAVPACPGDAPKPPECGPKMTAKVLADREAWREIQGVQARAKVVTPPTSRHFVSHRARAVRKALRKAPQYPERYRDMKNLRKLAEQLEQREQEVLTCYRRRKAALQTD